MRNKYHTKQEIYDAMCHLITDYEQNEGVDNPGVTDGDLYQMLVDIQSNWETLITAEDPPEEIKSLGRVKYVCGNCLTPFPAGYSDGDGCCLSCHADNWVEERDFEDEELVDWIKSIAKSHRVNGPFLRSLFRLECVEKKLGRVAYKDPLTGDFHSYPIHSKLKPDERKDCGTSSDPHEHERKAQWPWICGE